MNTREGYWALNIISLVAAWLWLVPAQAEDTQRYTGPVLELNSPSTITTVQPVLQRRNFGDQPVKITDLNGRVLSSIPLPADRVITEALPTREVGELSSQFIVRPTGTVSVTLANEPVDLPGGVAVEHADNPDAGGWFQPTLAASPTPAVWDEALNRYRMHLSLGLRGDNLPANATLEQPITVQFGFRGLIADPFEAVTLEHSGLENEIQLEFLFLPTAGQPVLELRSTITDIDYPIEAMNRLELRPVQDSMMGLGLDEVLVRVLHLRPDGTADNTVGTQTATVEVTSGSAVPDPSVVSLQGGNAEFLLRSRGLEDANIRVTAGALSDSLTIRQRFPTGPILAALVGGALGGFSRRFSRQAADGSTAARMAEGLAVAVIAYVAGVLGVGFLGLPVAVVSTEAGAFLTGALTGFIGVTVIETLSKRLTRGQ
ncbi:hypothetical protein [Saccharospirillum impatiens]|uniref:hypothetical protein n=1 Tax=Saccharospirillum impatiens TaxID=169438 RepID=UPI0003F7CA59|nr:hypothetical protein [Saccharospirillum impatiens]